MKYEPPRVFPAVFFYSFLHFPESVTDPLKAVETAYRRKLDVLCVTDHNTIQGALIAQKHAQNIEVVVGEEISSADGEILALLRDQTHAWRF